MPVLSATRKAVALAPPLPIANRRLAEIGLAFRRGQFSILAAAPGVGKSVFATNLALHTPVPTLFFSADSDEWTVRTRACSILSKIVLTQVEKHLVEDKWEAHYADLLRQVDHVDWSYRTDIELDFIVDRMNAHAEQRGEYPQLIIVDNLGNTVIDQDNEYAELRGTCRELQRIARSTNAHVMALHHVKGAKENGHQPITLGDLLGNLGKIPEQVLGLCRSGEDTVTLTAPKNRGGKSGISMQLGLHYPTAIVEGYA